jgi:FlaG/FlaF family flagellin (archaellin)
MAEEASGAVELAVIAFPGSQFKGEIVPALADLVDAGTITILDLVLVSKTEEGDVVVIEIDEADDPAMFDDLDGEVTGILSDEDALAAGDALDPGNTAAVIVWENTWARALVGAIRNAGGLLVAHDRLDAETVNEALATIGA